MKTFVFYNPSRCEFKVRDPELFNYKKQPRVTMDDLLDGEFYYQNAILEWKNNDYSEAALAWFHYAASKHHHFASADMLTGHYRLRFQADANINPLLQQRDLMLSLIPRYGPAAHLSLLEIDFSLAMHYQRQENVGNLDQYQQLHYRHLTKTKLFHCLVHSYATKILQPHYESALYNAYRGDTLTTAIEKIHGETLAGNPMDAIIDFFKQYVPEPAEQAQALQQARNMALPLHTATPSSLSI